MAGENIVRMANDRADSIVAAAEDKATSLRHGADEYSDRTLASLEAEVAKVAEQIRAGREVLAGRLVAAWTRRWRSRSPSASLRLVRGPLRPLNPVVPGPRGTLAPDTSSITSPTTVTVSRRRGQPVVEATMPGLVVDIVDLPRATGSVKNLRIRTPAPADLGTEVIGVPEGSDLALDVT